MQRFRKKPIEVDAFQMTAEQRESNEDWPNWLHEAWNKNFDEPGCVFPLASALMVCTLEGALVVSVDDWIIKGVKGELYPCKPDIFAETYDPVEKAR